jgi:hypothetical protein
MLVEYHLAESIFPLGKIAELIVIALLSISNVTSRNVQ